MFAADENVFVYQKELTEYDKVRKPHKLINDLEIKPEELLNTVNSNFICPICLDLIENTMVTECLHRFCSECICNAIYKSKRECPTCRKKVISKRNLRPDPNFDQLIAAVWPDRKVYEQLQKEEAAKCKQNVQAFQASFEEFKRKQKALQPIENGNIKVEGSSSIQKNDVVGKRGKSRRPSKFQPKMEQNSPDSGFEADILPPDETTKTIDDEFGFGDSDSTDETSETDESSLDDSEMEEEIGVGIEDFGSSSSENEDEEPPKKQIKLEEIGPKMPSTRNWLPPNISTLRKFQTMELFMKEYSRRTNAMGTVKLHLEYLPNAFKGIRINWIGEKSQIVQCNFRFRIELMHNTTIGTLHSVVTSPEFHPYKRKPDGNFPEIHLFIQGPSKELIALNYRDTICTVLGLANRKNFLEFPTIYFV